MHLLHARRQASHAPAAALLPGGAPVQALAFDDPWLAAALGDGATLLLNADAAMRGGSACSGSSANPSRAAREAASARYTARITKSALTFSLHVEDLACSMDCCLSLSLSYSICAFLS
jgi:hypothetical protein